MRICRRNFSLRTISWIVFFTSLLLLSPISTFAEESLRLYTFTNLGCSQCVKALEPLQNLYNESIITYDVQESNYTQKFDMITSLVGTDVYIELPLIGVFKKGRLTAIVFSVHSEKDWEDIVRAEYEGVPVYSNLYDLNGKLHYDKILTDQNMIDTIAKLFTNDEQIESIIGHRDLNSLLPFIVMAALVDAVNPCEFYVLAVFLSLIVFRFGRKAVLKDGLAYAIAIFIAYYLLGVGILRLIGYAQQMRFLIAAIFGFLGFVMGFREVLGVILSKEFKNVPDFFSKKLSVYLRKASENPMSAFIIGLVSGIFLLPCTSAPYLIALSLIASLQSILEGMFLLTIYNGIIMVPFIAITLGIYVLQLKTGDLKRWSSGRQKWVNVASGLLIIFLGLYLLSTLIT